MFHLCLTLVSYCLHLGTSLADLLKEAVVMSQSQQRNHDKFTATFPSGTTQKWEKMVDDWNANRKAPNPYTESVAGKHFLYVFTTVLLILISRYINYESPS